MDASNGIETLAENGYIKVGAQTLAPTPKPPKHVKLVLKVAVPKVNQDLFVHTEKVWTYKLYQDQLGHNIQEALRAFKLRPMAFGAADNNWPVCCGSPCKWHFQTRIKDGTSTTAIFIECAHG